jgi:hypothetical protein
VLEIDISKALNVTSQISQSISEMEINFFGN